MTPAIYKQERKKRGSQALVAKWLGISQAIIAKRENGERVIKEIDGQLLLSLPCPLPKTFCDNHKSGAVMTFEQIGSELGITDTRAMQIFNNAMRKIRQRILPVVKELKPELAMKLKGAHYAA